MCLLAVSFCKVLSEIVMETERAVVSQMADNYECGSCQHRCWLETSQTPMLLECGSAQAFWGGLGSHLTSCEGLHSVGLIISLGLLDFFD